jgi:hypothetical protein|tara:strand:+ start:130 stop:447 length:318 start_codon:yes stop_codon:yes gene_type:complete
MLAKILILRISVGTLITHRWDVQGVPLSTYQELGKPIVKKPIKKDGISENSKPSMNRLPLVNAARSRINRRFNPPRITEAPTLSNPPFGTVNPMKRYKIGKRAVP